METRQAQQTFEYVVIGAGSAGCVLAHRLVKAGRSVCLLEAGPRDDTPFVHMPATFVKVIGTERTWLYESEPQASAQGRKMVVPQGRTLGGGSSVNAMVYTRGTPSRLQRTGLLKARAAGLGMRCCPLSKGREQSTLGWLFPWQ